MILIFTKMKRAIILNINRIALFLNSLECLSTWFLVCLNLWCVRIVLPCWNNSNLYVQVQSERYFFGNLDKANNNYYFLDVEARYVVNKNKLSFFLSANNLFNTKTYRNYSISDINVSKTAYRLLPSYVLLKLEYRF